MADVQYAECAVWVVINENGDYVARGDEECAVEDFESDYTALATRKIKLTLRIPLPEVKTIEMQATLPEVPEGAEPVKIEMTAT